MVLQRIVQISTRPALKRGASVGLQGCLVLPCIKQQTFSNVGTYPQKSRQYSPTAVMKRNRIDATWFNSQLAPKYLAKETPFLGTFSRERQISTSRWWNNSPPVQDTASAVSPPDVTPHQSAYDWLDKEAEDLIARSYARHRSLAAKAFVADKHSSFPPSLEASTEELEALAKPYHYAPKDVTDKVAYGLMRFLRVFTHAFFREKYDHHAVTLETVAAVPGMVAAFHRHLRSLRTMRRDHGWINPLLEEAENERMHLLIFMKVTQPNWLERVVVFFAQGAYTLAYSVLYFFNGRAAHRLVGYLEEEAHRAYTDYLNAIDSGRIPNKPAPQIAKDYYHLPADARMREVVLHVRADECMHRDTNHHFGDKYLADDLDSAPTGMQKIGGGGEEKVKEREFRLEDDVDART